MYMCLKTPLCRRPVTFDAEADGTVLGEGWGGLEKRLDDCDATATGSYAIHARWGPRATARQAVSPRRRAGRSGSAQAYQSPAPTRHDRTFEAGTGTKVGDAVEPEPSRRFTGARRGCGGVGAGFGRRKWDIPRHCRGRHDQAALAVPQCCRRLEFAIDPPVPFLTIRLTTGCPTPIPPGVSAWVRRRNFHCVLEGSGRKAAVEWTAMCRSLAFRAYKARSQAPVARQPRRLEPIRATDQSRGFKQVIGFVSSWSSRRGKAVLSPVAAAAQARSNR